MSTSDESESHGSESHGSDASRATAGETGGRFKLIATILLFRLVYDAVFDPETAWSMKYYVIGLHYYCVQLAIWITQRFTGKPGFSFEAEKCC